jgi:hypothetical protein
MRRFYLALVATLIAITLAVPLSSCGATVTSTVTATSTPTSTKTNPDWIQQVKSARVVAHAQNWNSNAEDDGIRVWVELQDEKEKFVMYDDVNMPVRIELFSTESKTFPWQTSRLLYSSQSEMQNWSDDAFVTGATGIKDIPWGDISPTLASEQQDYGLLYVTITLPNGQNYSAKYDEARLKSSKTTVEST